MPATACTAMTSAARRSRSIPIDKVTPQDRVPLLVRSKGAELGIRTKAIEGLTSSVAVFVLDFDSELLFVGDAGTTEASRPSRRVGVEWVNQYKPEPWLSFDLDLAYTRARFTDFDPAGDRIPGAPAWIASGAITFGSETGWFGALKARYFGPRPLIEDDSVRSLSSLIFNARAGYRFDNGLRTAARRAQSLRRADQPDRILLSVAPAGRADRRRRRPSCPSGRAARGAPHIGRSFLIALRRLLAVGLHWWSAECRLLRQKCQWEN